MASPLPLRLLAVGLVLAGVHAAAVVPSNVTAPTPGNVTAASCSGAERFTDGTCVRCPAGTAPQLPGRLDCVAPPGASIAADEAEVCFEGSAKTICVQLPLPGGRSTNGAALLALACILGWGCCSAVCCKSKGWHEASVGNAPISKGSYQAPGGGGGGGGGGGQVEMTALKKYNAKAAMRGEFGKKPKTKFDVRRLQTNCKIALNRMKVQRTKHENDSKMTAKEVAACLRDESYGPAAAEAMARVKVEHVIRAKADIHALEILEVFLEMIGARWMQIEQTGPAIPADLIEGVISVVWGAKRANNQEMMVVRELLIVRYWNEFCSMASETAGVNPKLVEYLVPTAPSETLVGQYLDQIAAVYCPEWQSVNHVDTDVELAQRAHDMDELEGLTAPTGKLRK